MNFNYTANLILEKVEGYTAIPLPYKFTDLEPYIDEETMKLHYNKHYKGYITKLNEIITNKIPLRELVIKAGNKKADIINNAGGAYNHELLWNMMTPEKTHITGKLKELIEKKFKTVDNFYNEFLKSALSHFGSGWVWLVKVNNTLYIKHTNNQDNPLMYNEGIPILGIDVWEHAYYKKYGPDREKYIKNFLKVVNWDYCSLQLYL